MTIDVLEEGSKGLFGLFGSRQAKVRLTPKEEEVDPRAGLTDEPKTKPAPQREKVQPKQEAKVDAPKPVPKAVPAQERKPEPKQEAPKAETVKAKPAPKQDKPKAKPAPRQDKGAEAEKPKAKPAPKAPVQPLEKPEVTMIPADAVEEDSAPGRALAFLKELTHLMGVEVDVAVGTDKDGNVYANMTGDTLGILIGRRGETLDALQYLTSLKVNREINGTAAAVGHAAVGLRGDRNRLGVFSLREPNRQRGACGVGRDGQR